jgi:hypothetical protein
MIVLILAPGALSSGYADCTSSPLDYPGASGTGAIGINGEPTIAGGYYDTSGVAQGLSLSGMRGRRNVGDR